MFYVSTLNFFRNRRKLFDIEFLTKRSISLDVYTSLKMIGKLTNVFEMLFPISRLLLPKSL